MHAPFVHVVVICGSLSIISCLPLLFFHLFMLPFLTIIPFPPSSFSLFYIIFPSSSTPPYSLLNTSIIIPVIFSSSLPLSFCIFSFHAHYSFHLSFFFNSSCFSLPFCSFCFKIPSHSCPSKLFDFLSINFY